MSHDLYLTGKNNYCEHCKRSDDETLGETNVSYNHCWIWYDKFDKESGFRAMYNIPLVKLVSKLEKLREDLIFTSGGIPTHEMNKDGTIEWSDKKIRPIDCGQYDYDKYVRDDGWARTNYNAFRCIEEILKISTNHVIAHPNAIWYGD
jgi:hypothetical protein